MNLLTSTAINLFDDLYPDNNSAEFISDAMITNNVKVEELSFGKVVKMQEKLINAIELTYSMATQEKREVSSKEKALKLFYDGIKKDIFSGKEITIGDDSTHADGKPILKNNDTRTAFVEYVYHHRHNIDINALNETRERVDFWEQRKKIIHHQKETLDSWIKAEQQRTK